MMKRIFFCSLIFSLAAAGFLRADETTSAVQTRLKAGGFYFGEVNGRYDSDTVAAVTRYQIRNGLQISGKLDAPTRHALGVTADTEPEPSLRGFGEDAWRHLRKSDQEYLDRLAAEDAKVPTPSKPAVTSTRPPGPEIASRPPTKNATTPGSNRERLRDYVGAFILAGLDPHVGSEAEFFADRVDYFGEPNVTREKIRRDLQRYDNRWPQRAFWLAGELEVTPAEGNLKVSFPLRYDLKNASKHSAGTVHKTLILEKIGADDYQIVSVNERRAHSH
jgi:peptidoglycan hydrolase-like protein with peptidoglycan-binding domain